MTSGDMESAGAELLGVPLTVLDMLALVAALLLTMAMAPLGAFNHDDIVAADLRWASQPRGANSSAPMMQAMLGDGAHTISYGISGFCAWCSIGFLISIFCIISVRVGVSLTHYVPPALRATYMRLLRPLLWLALLTFTLGSCLFMVGLYFIGWVVLPAEVASDWGWTASGSAFIMFSIVLFAYLAVIFLCFFSTRSKRLALAAANRLKVVKDNEAKEAKPKASV